MLFLLQRLDKQALRAFDSDADDRTASTQPHGELGNASNVMRDLALLEQPTGGVQNTELMMGITPVDADEHTLDCGRLDH